MSNTREFPTGRCGFCGATGYDSCREFLVNVADHPERPKASLFILELHGATIEAVDTLFIPELDGLVASTAEQAYEWEEQRLQYEQEAYAEGAWLRHAENNEQYRWEVEQDELRAYWGL